MKDGDIYFWQWKNLEDRHMPHHCRSHKAVVKNGVLRETFWSSCSSIDGALRLEDIEISYQGNIYEMSEISEHYIPYYRSEDIVDMRHSNNSGAPVYLQAGAERNGEAMRAHVQYLIERSKSEIQMASDRIKQLNEALAMIDAGKLDEVYL